MPQQDHGTTNTAPNTSKDDNLETRGLCILSLDGGGVRGLSTLFLLRALMRRLNDERRLLKLEPRKPCEVFDLIGGTSTGGLIAIMLGRLEMDVDDCITAYKALMTTVFKKKKNVFTLSLTGMIRPRFSSKVLEESIKSVIKTCRPPEQEEIPADAAFCVQGQDEDSQKCRVFVCAQRKETGTIVPLRSYCCKGEDPETATIWQAALATSAATSFFDSVKIGDCTFIDGAMGANNPARELEHEADQIWCEVTGKLEPLVKCFISLGTGNGGINPMTDKAWKFLTKSLTAVATDTRATAQDVAIRWKDHQNTRYFRFNVEQGLQKVGLEEYKRIDLLEAATKDYLNHADTRPRVRSCVENLRTKKYRPTSSFCISQQTLQATESQKKQPPPDPITEAETYELLKIANTHLKLPRDKITPDDLLAAYSIFVRILRAKRTQQPTPTPKELTYLHDKLRATCLRLSHPKVFSPAQRMAYIDEATRFGEHAVEYAIATRNDERVAQMRFHVACVRARKVQLQEVEEELESPTVAEKEKAVEEVEMSYATLKSIDGTDMSGYSSAKRECLDHVEFNGRVGRS